ncbi:hypothetical protein OsJ_28701 [Oryza sativa Japonica Group]|uniref:Uncharacterized protein n=2 Tax=Oryza TaxID=4527 RepID=A3BWZ3_ORYSJ|nr:hypothetical protein OsJ_28701 [Oryza sativa Japonica Group]
MEGKPSGLPSSTGGKGKGVPVVGANPWHSDDGCDGSKSSRRLMTLTIVIYFQRILSGGSEMQTPGANSYGANSGHQRDADSGMFLSFSEKTQVQTNKDIPESWKVHPRKDEVDPDGWVVEIHLRNDQKTKDKRSADASVPSRGKISSNCAPWN